MVGTARGVWTLELGDVTVLCAKRPLRPFYEGDMDIPQ